jgi:hypothetical protein
MTENDTKILALCPTCGGERQAHVRGQYKLFTPGPEDVHITARILECGGCQTIFFREDVWCTAWATGDGDDIDVRYWPKTSTQSSPITREIPYWLDKVWIFWPQADATLVNLLGETYSATNSGLLVLAAIGIRTIIDRSSELLGVDPSKTFACKLAELVRLRKISVSEEEVLGILIDAGSAATHRGWKPAPSELNTMLEVMESFLKRQFISDDIKKLKEAVPPKNGGKKRLT